MGTLDSREYDRLVKRGFKDYSVGHQRMYTKAVAEICRTTQPKTARIFEAGFGIGFGLKKMVEADAFGEYYGCEPQIDSYRYTVQQFANTERSSDLHLYHEPFTEGTAQRLLRDDIAPFDEMFCIEVIEHLPLDQHLQALIAMRSITNRLWLSTPDKKKSKEGVRTMRDWTVLLKQAQFEVTVDTSEWTYLYRCE